MTHSNSAAVVPSFSFEDLEAGSQTMLNDTIVAAHITFTPRIALVNATKAKTPVNLYAPAQTSQKKKLD